MLARNRALLVFVALSATLGGCASFQARGAFGRGQKAQNRGDLPEAIAAYSEAAQRDPSKPEYAAALETARAEAADSRAKAAVQAEGRGEMAEAVRLWDEAIRFQPTSEALKARRALAELRTKQADPVEFYRAAKRLADALPGDASAAATLEEARRSAVAYHLRLANVYADAKAWDRAHAEYQIAREIEPAHPVFATEKFRDTSVRQLEAMGDAKLAQGDALGAYQAYEQAAAVRNSPHLQQKMAKAKRGAGSLIEQLEQAETFARLGKWEDAAELYTLVMNRPGAPADVGEKARRARAESARMRAERANAYAERGLVDKAGAELTLALEHTDGPVDLMPLLAKGVEALVAGRPGDARAAFDTAAAKAPDLAVVKVAPGISSVVAKRAYEDAKAEAARDPADALVALRRLERFKAELPGYDAERNKLLRSAFGALLERAEARGAEGQFDRAAELLGTALEISKAPPELQEPLTRGAKALEARQYDNARVAFDAAVAADARSRLAKTGQTVARQARLAELHRDAAEALVVEDNIRASASYRAILDIDPNDPSARAGIDELKGQLVGAALASAKSHEAEGRPNVAFIYYRRVLDVDPENVDAKAAAGKLGANVKAATEPQGLVAPVLRGDHLGAACPDLEKQLRDRLVLYLNRTPGVGASYLAKEATQAVDEGKAPAPPVLLRTAVERCETAKASGTVGLSYQLLLGGRAIGQGRVDANFDPSSVPKDELQDGLPPSRILTEVLGAAATTLSLELKKKAPELAGWRVVESKARLAAADPEAVAEWYGAMSAARNTLTEAERQSMAELERFLMNRYR